MEVNCSNRRRSGHGKLVGKNGPFKSKEIWRFGDACRLAGGPGTALFQSRMTANAQVQET